MYRTHTCGELRIEHVDNTVTLSGWVAKRRDFGSLSFIDLRDRYGITQLSFNEAYNKDLLEQARTLGREFVIQAIGKVTERSNKNAKIPTGEIEIVVEQLTILNVSLTPPFTIEEETDGGEDIRMQYRYLDLRRDNVRQNLILRHQVAKAVRKYLDHQDFIEVETPVLIKSTPEGARDFVVPSRMNQGQFYALPQSPQTFKQLLMVSGFDRYYQIVKCFRDEDLRADRQPEFTQIDCEMSFVEQEDILNLFEGLVQNLFTEVKGLGIGTLPRMTFDDAMRRYGNDKPDIRFGMEFQYITELTKGKNFPVFESAETVIAICASGCGTYTRKQLDELTEWVKRPQIGAKGLVYVFCNADGTYKSSVDKFYSSDDLKLWAGKCDAKEGDLLLLMSGDTKNVQKQMSELRLEMGARAGFREFKFGMHIKDRSDYFSGENKVYSIRLLGRDYPEISKEKLVDFIKSKLKNCPFSMELLELEDNKVENVTGKVSLDRNKLNQLIELREDGSKREHQNFFILVEGDGSVFNYIKSLRTELGAYFKLSHKDDFKPLWVIDFPLLEFDGENHRWHAMHHPFTSPKPADIPLLDTDPGAIRANAYDMVINGVEVGGGSIRIFNKDLQAKMFKTLGFTEEDARYQFGFLMNAFEYGAPPHGGIAFGFDRLCSLFGGADGIRDFIAFPKNNQGRDVMIDAPSVIDESQLKELGMKLCN